MWNISLITFFFIVGIGKYELILLGVRKKVLKISAIQAAIAHDEKMPNTPKATKNRTNISFNTDKVVF
jgi:hypothetical protein